MIPNLKKDASLMDRFAGRVALVTGASSGIGAAICKRLAECGMKVIGVARKIQPIIEMKKRLKESSASGILTAIACDITIDKEVYALFEKVKELYGGVDVCVNSAGRSYKYSLLDGSPEEWRQMTNLNVISVCLISKLALKSMMERNINDGQLINISSVAAHLTATSAPNHFYTATKHALQSITEGLRLEMRELKKKIRIACISPGVVDTDFFKVQFGDEISKIIEKSPAFKIEQLKAEDVANCAIYIISAPPNVEINDVVMRPVEETV